MRIIERGERISYPKIPAIFFRKGTVVEKRGQLFEKRTYDFWIHVGEAR